MLFVYVVTSASGGRGGGRGSSGSRSSSSRSRGSGSSGSSSGGGFFSRLFGSKSSSSSGSSSGGSTSHSSSHGTSQSNSGSYPKQTYNTGSQSNTNYGWNTNSGGHGHYYNSPSSSTNWGSTYNSPSYHQQPQNAFGNFHPVTSGVAAPSYHFHRSTSYIPIYIPSSHTYIHQHYHQNSQSTSTTNNDPTPPPPPSEPVVYKEDSLSSNYGESSDTKPTMIVGFNNMIVYGVYENERHFVITVSDDLDEDESEIPEKFLHIEDSSLFEIVTLKPTTTTPEPTTTMESFLTNDNTTDVFVLDSVIDLND